MMSARDDKESLPAYQRSRQINDIFTSVQNILPDMDFSDLENENDNEFAEIVKREPKPIVTCVSNRDEEVEFLTDSDEIEQIHQQEHSQKAEKEMIFSGQKAEKEIVELSVHSFIDELVGQVSDAPQPKKSDSYKLEQSTDIDLDKLITLLDSTPDIALAGREDDSDDESVSSTSTIVMDELERLAESFDVSEYGNIETPRETTPDVLSLSNDLKSPSKNLTPPSNNLISSNNSTSPSNPLQTSSNNLTSHSNNLTSPSHPLKSPSNPLKSPSNPLTPTTSKKATYNSGSSPGRVTPVLKYQPEIGSPSGSAEPETVKLDLRPKSHQSNPRPTSRRIVPAYLAKKQQMSRESDSDDEVEQNTWLEMRRNMKSTSFFSNKEVESGDGSQPKAKSFGGTTQSSGVSTQSSGTSTQISGVSTQCSGASTQSSGVSTRSSGTTTQSSGVSTQSSGTSTQSFGISTQKSSVSYKSSGVSTQNSGVSTLNSGVSTKSFGASTQNFGVSAQNFSSSDMRTSDSNHESISLTDVQITTDSQSESSTVNNKYSCSQAQNKSVDSSILKAQNASKKSVKRSTGDKMQNANKIIKKGKSNDNDISPEATIYDSNKSLDVSPETTEVSPKIAWMKDNDNLIKYDNIKKQNSNEVAYGGKTPKSLLIRDEGDQLKLKRLEQMKIREKRAEFRNRLEDQNKNPATQLIFDVEESFVEDMVDVRSDVQDDSDNLLMLQLLIDNQGELSSLPPEYYAFCYDDIPTVSYYGTEGVLTWVLTSQNKPFRVEAARLTYVNNCLTYIFLVENTSGSGSSFYKNVGEYLSKHTIAQSDPSLFKSTLLNPRDYPFCETLSKIFLLSKYDPEQCSLFTSQPSWFTSNLSLDKANEGTKKKLSVSELQANVSPATGSEFCVTTISGSVLKSQGGLFHVLASVRDAQLEISGTRIVHANEETNKQTNKQTLCLVVSGFSATTKWAEKLGPVDAGLAMLTDPDSVRAVLSKLNLKEYTLTNTRTVDKTRQELARYFGYRFADCSSFTTAIPTYPAVFERAYDYFFLLVSPLISPSLLGEILLVLQDNGVSLLGIRRSRLNYRKCVGLGLSESQIKVFSKFNGTPLTSPSLSSSNGSTPGEMDRQFFPQNFKTDASPSQPTLASTILFLSKRNGLYHSRHIIHELKNRVVDVNLNHTLQSDEALHSREQLTDPYLYFEMVPHSENDLWNVGGQFGLMPERKTFDFFMSHKQEVITEKCDLEQIVFIGLIGTEVVQAAGKEIYDIIHFCNTLGVSCGDHETGLLELLGVKLIGKLSSFQAREVTQYEVGDSQWKSDIQYLQTVPVLALIVRGINAFNLVKQLLTHKESVTSRVKPRDYSRIMSETPEHAYKLASLLFFEKELYSDEIMRPKQLHLPPPRTHVNSVISKEGRSHLADLPDRLVYQSEGILKSMLSPPRLIASVLVSSQIQHFGKILKRLEQEEFTVIGGYLSRDDQMVLCVQAENSVYKLKQLVGPPDLKEAKISHQFSLRASFAANSDDFYASQTYSDSVSDVKRYFPDGLCCQNTLDLQAEGIPHSYIDTEISLNNDRRYLAKPCLLKPLLQTVCLVVPPDLLRPAKHMRLSPASQLLTLIQSCQFEIVNMRLLTIPSTHIQHFRGLFKIHVELTQTFVNRACLVLVLQRENAASCFSQILQGYSNNNNKKLLESYEHMLLTSSNRQKCELQIRFFFDFLSTRCKDSIET